MKYLIENGVNIHTNDDYVLHYSDNNFDIAKYLIDNGADPNKVLAPSTSQRNLNII